MNKALFEDLVDTVNAHIKGGETAEELIAITKTASYFSSELIEETLDELATKLK